MSCGCQAFNDGVLRGDGLARFFLFYSSRESGLVGSQDGRDIDALFYGTDRRNWPSTTIGLPF